jgi:transposase
VKRERLAFLSADPKYTQRFAMKVGALCRAMTIADVARHTDLDWHRVKELDKIYMREQLRVAGPAVPRVIGIDEIAIRKRHNYRIVVSDLERKRAIWFGGQGRSETSSSISCGRTHPKLGRERFSTTGKRNCVGNVSNRMKSSPR